MEYFSEDHRDAVLDALADYRKWFDDKDKTDCEKIRNIDAAINAVEGIFIPQTKLDEVENIISNIEELKEYEWQENELSAGFIKRMVLEFEKLREKVIASDR